MNKKYQAVILTTEDRKNTSMSIKQHLEELELVESHITFASKEALHLFTEEPTYGVLIFTCYSREDFVEGVALNRTLRKKVGTQMIRTICVLGIQSSKAENILFRNQITDIFDDHSLRSGNGIKALVRKIDFYSRGQMSLSPEKDYNYSSGDEEGEAAELGDETVESGPDSNQNQEDMAFSELDISKRFRDMDDEITQDIDENAQLEAHLDTNISLESGEDILDCVIEIFEGNEMTLELPTLKEVKDGEKINVQVNLFYNDCSVNILTAGVVTEIQRIDDEGCQVVTLKLERDETSKIQNFMALFQKKQEDVNDFIRRAQGLE